MPKKTKKNPNTVANEQTLKEFRKLMTKSAENEEKLRENADYLVLRRGISGYKRSTIIQIFQILEKAKFHNEAEAWSRGLIGMNLFHTVSQSFKISMSSVTDSNLQSNMCYMQIKKNCDLTLCDSLSKYDFVHNLHPNKCPKERLFWTNQIAPDVLESLQKFKYELPEIRFKNNVGTEVNLNFDKENLLECPNYQKMKKQHMMPILNDKFKLQMASALKRKKMYDEALFWLETYKNDFPRGRTIPILSFRMGCFWCLGDMKNFVLTADTWIEVLKEEFEADEIYGLEEFFMQYLPDFENPGHFYEELANALMNVRRYRDAYPYFEVKWNSVRKSFYVHTSCSVNHMYQILEASVKAKDCELVKRALSQMPSDILTASEPEVMKLRLKNLYTTLEDAELKMMIMPQNSPDVKKNFGQYLETTKLYTAFIRFCILRSNNLELFPDTKTTMFEWLDMAFIFIHELIVSNLKLTSKHNFFVMHPIVSFPLITLRSYLHFEFYHYNYCPTIFRSIQYIIRNQCYIEDIDIQVHQVVKKFNLRTKVFKFYKENWSILNNEGKRQISMLRNSYLINDHFQIKFAE